jgi:hypothetical protein
MKLNHKLYLAATAVLILIIWNANSQPGVGDLIGGFEEVAMYRNENNTGPIKRVYVVSISDLYNAEMRAYGDYMLHTKFGNTKVYFFAKGDIMPLEVKGGEVNFDSKFDQYIFAKYEKNASGLVNFQQFQ